MRLRAVKDVQIVWRIIQRVAVNMMDNLPSRRPGNFPVLPISARSLRPVAVSVCRRLQRRLVAVRLSYQRPSGSSLCVFVNRADHHVAAAVVATVGQPSRLLLVGKERVAVISPHLVMSHTEFARDCGPLAMQAPSPNLPASPLVIRAAVPSDPLVMHQAKAVCRVLPPAAFNCASLQCFAPKLIKRRLPHYIKLGKRVEAMQ